VKRGDAYGLEFARPQSVGRVHSFFGNFGVLVRAYAYIRSLGPDGLAEISREAILNANYLLRRLTGAYDLPFDRPCMHEFVLSAKNLRKHGVRTTDVAKRLLDFGVHAPTVYFPLIVEEAIMVETDGDGDAAHARPVRGRPAAHRRGGAHHARRRHPARRGRRR